MQEHSHQATIDQWVREGKDYDAIHQLLVAAQLEADELKPLLEYTDERLYHRELEQQYRSKNYLHLLMGLAILGLAGYIAYITRDAVFTSVQAEKVAQFIFLVIALIGGWLVKEAWKKLRTPFEPPENFGYQRKKFQRF